MSGYLMMNSVLVLFGGYLVWISVQMKRSGIINSMLLPPEELKKIKDTKNFIRLIAPAVILFGLLLMLLGIAGVVMDEFFKNPYWKYIELVLFLLGFVLFSKKFKTVKEGFFNEKMYKKD